MPVGSCPKPTVTAQPSPASLHWSTTGTVPSAGRQEQLERTGSNGWWGQGETLGSRRGVCGRNTGACQSYLVRVIKVDGTREKRCLFPPLCAASILSFWPPRHLVAVSTCSGLSCEERRLEGDEFQYSNIRSFVRPPDRCLPTYIRSILLHDSLSK